MNDSSGVPAVRRRAAAPAYVYVIGAPEYRQVKIGYGVDPEARLSNLQTANPFPLEILFLSTGGRAAERVLHQEFAQHRGLGEWFEFPEGVDPVEAVRDAMARLLPGEAEEKVDPVMEENARLMDEEEARAEADTGIGFDDLWSSILDGGPHPAVRAAVARFLARRGRPRRGSTD